MEPERVSKRRVTFDPERVLHKAPKLPVPTGQGKNVFAQVNISNQETEQQLNKEIMCFNPTTLNRIFHFEKNTLPSQKSRLP